MMAKADEDGKLLASLVASHSATLITVRLIASFFCLLGPLGAYDFENRQSLHGSLLAG